MPLAARSPLPTTTSCSSYPLTSNDGVPSNSTTYCDDISDGGVLALTLCIAGPLVLIVVIFLAYLLLQWIRPRPNRGPKPDSDPDQSTLEKIDFDDNNDDDGSATCVNVPNVNNRIPALAGEVDISSSLSYYHDHQQLQESNHSVTAMPFLRKGLLRAASTSSCPPDGRRQGTTPPAYNFQATPPLPPPLASRSAAQHHADSDSNSAISDADPSIGYGSHGRNSHNAPTFTTNRLRSFSESTITLFSSSSNNNTFSEDFYGQGSSRNAPSTSLPSSPSPSIPPPPGSAAGRTTTATTTATPPSASFSLSLSEKLERLNKQMLTMQKKTSNSSLRGWRRTGAGLSEEDRGTPDSPSICCGNDSAEGGGGGGGGGGGDTSMDFKCRGLPESGTFSVLTDLEAAMRVEDELDTIERLALRV